MGTKKGLSSTKKDCLRDLLGYRDLPLRSHENGCLKCVWGATKTVHKGQNKNIEITTIEHSAAFPEQFVLYLKVLAHLVPEI